MVAHKAGGNGGSQPVFGQSVVLGLNVQPDLALLTPGETILPLAWDVLMDNTVNFNTLTEIPDGMGLSFAFDGSSAQITATEDGAWWFQLDAVLAEDATFQGYIGLASIDLGDGFFGPGIVADDPNQDFANLVYGVVMKLPAGTVTNIFIKSTAAPTASPYLSRALNASIIRLA
jgi:hypothetical protein